MEIKLPDFSDRIKELRKERGIKQSEMAELLDCKTNHYQRIEYGYINVPALMLMQLADFFEVSTDYLLGRTDRRDPPAAPAGSTQSNNGRDCQ